MNPNQWIFDQAPNGAAITCTHITRDGDPILLVTHYEDDHSWGFLSGKPVVVEDGQVVAMKTIVDLDPTVMQVADLPPGWSAERDAVGDIWSKYKDEWDE